MQRRWQFVHTSPSHLIRIWTGFGRRGSDVLRTVREQSCNVEETLKKKTPFECLRWLVPVGCVEHFVTFAEKSQLFVSEFLLRSLLARRETDSRISVRGTHNWETIRDCISGKVTIWSKTFFRGRICVCLYGDVSLLRVGNFRVLWSERSVSVFRTISEQVKCSFT